jgi:predicted RNase H-like HicB family nuclease
MKHAREKRVKTLHYSVNIQWSDRNQAYLVNVPELPGCHTHGDTYEEALKNALEVIKLWIEAAKKDGLPIPPPKVAV